MGINIMIRKKYQFWFQYRYDSIAKYWYRSEQGSVQVKHKLSVSIYGTHTQYTTLQNKRIGLENGTFQLIPPILGITDT